MFDSNEPRDAQLDRNLRNIGQHLSLPASPGAADRARWKSARPAGPLSNDHQPALAHSKGNSFMRKSRFWAACSTAVAATFVLFVFFSSWQPSGAAMAATIFRSLRESAHRGISVVIENVEAEKVHLNGRVQLLFPEPISLAQFATDNATFPTPEALYVELKVQSDDADSASGKADVELNSVLTQDNKWAFLRIARLPGEDGDELQPLLMLLPALRTGLLLDLNNVDELKDWSSIFANEDDECPQTSTTSAKPSGVPSVTTKTEVSFEVVDADAQEESQPANHATSKLQISGDIQPTEGFRDLISGAAGKERIAEIVSEIEKYARQVDVQQTDSESWVLRAGNFQIDGLDADEAKFVEKAELVVHYSQGVGITFAELLHLGERDGRLRFEFIDAIDPALLSNQRYIDAGVPPLDVSKLMATFGNLAGGDDE